MGWKEFENKHVFCKSKQGIYSGKFLGYEKPFLVILDKYNNKVLINETEILKFVEEDSNTQNLKSEVIPKGNTKQGKST